MNRAVLPALAGVILCFGACSGDDGPDAERSPATTSPARATLASDLAAAFSGDHAEDSAQETGECFADAFLAQVSNDDLRGAGLVDEDGALVTPLPTLTEDLAEPWVDAQQQCSDFITSSAEALAAQSKGKVDRDTYAACLEGALTEDEVRAGLEAAVTGRMQSAAVTVLSEAQGECSAEVLGEE